MPVLSIDALQGQQRRDWWRSVLFAVALILPCLVSLWYIGFFNPARWQKALPAVADLTSRMMPPSYKDHWTWYKPLLHSAVMSLAGTFIAVLIALPLSFLAARNISPHGSVYHLSRVVLNCMRATPTLVAACFFVAAFGFGPLPGALALGFHSAGVLGKFFAEILEHVDPGPIEAVKATGARPLQVLYHGYMSVSLPQLADAAIYRWECNFRDSVILGLIGAGGIGFELKSAFDILDYPQVAALTIVLVGLVTLVDWLGSRLRMAIK